MLSRVTHQAKGTHVSTPPQAGTPPAKAATPSPAPTPAAVAPAPAQQPTAPPPPFTLSSPSRSERYIKALIYGDFGVGKTTFAASSDDNPRLRDVLFIDAESGDMSVSNRPGVTSVRITDIRQLQAVSDFLAMHCRLRDAGNIEKLAQLESRFRGYPVDPKDVKKFRTVVIDSLSEVQKYVMYQIMGVKTGGRLDVEPSTPQFQDWGKNGEMVRLIVRTFRDMPVNAIFVCPEQLVEDASKTLHRRPQLPGKLGNEVQGFLDIVGYLRSFKGDDGQITRKLFISPGPTFQAKHRFSGLGNITAIDNPTMTSLLDLADQSAGVKK